VCAQRMSSRLPTIFPTHNLFCTMSDPEYTLLLNQDTNIKVSSTLDKSCGKKNLVDGSPETCWTSQQGIPQYVQLTLPNPMIPKRLSITFQGGFVGTRCALSLLLEPSESSTRKEWNTWTYVYPEDVNRQQTFDLPWSEREWGQGIDTIRIVFEESSDFFGRITVYDLQLFGMHNPTS